MASTELALGRLENRTNILAEQVGKSKQAIKGSDISEIQSARDGLNAAWHEAAQKMYANAQAQQQGPQPGGQQAGPETGTGGQKEPKAGKKSDSGAVDADYEVVD